ncbi:MAG TPA: hydrogenase small subunit [Thermomicrobiales bacterium]|nr:hydrogenase small subunit [Thermomicrobiales bacterium]
MTTAIASRLSSSLLTQISRRDLLKFSALMAGTLALPPRFTGRIARAIEQSPRPTVVWIELQDCAGCSESLLRTNQPDVAQAVLETFSWEYHELIMAGAGHQAEGRLAEIVRDLRGEYIAIVEGAIPTAEDGYCTIAGRSALDLAREVCTNARATIAAGACAWDGGFVAAGPTGAVGLQQAVPELSVINLAGCPPNGIIIPATLVHYLTFGEMPATDQLGRPLFAYGELIHDRCERRPHFDAGRFIREWDDEGHRKGWCLYHMGCRGPVTNATCPLTRRNDGTSWPVATGHGCVGCTAPRFWTEFSPFYDRLPGEGRGQGIEPTPATTPLPWPAYVAPTPTPAMALAPSPTVAAATPALVETGTTTVTPVPSATPAPQPPPPEDDGVGDVAIVGGAVAGAAAAATAWVIHRRSRSRPSPGTGGDDGIATPPGAGERNDDAAAGPTATDEP